MHVSRPAPASTAPSTARRCTAALLCALPLLNACGGGSDADEGSTSTGEPSTSGDLPTGDTSTATEPLPTGTGDTSTGCDGLALEQDAVLDLDIPAIQYVLVSGAVRVHGEALPDAAGSRGTLVFETSPSRGLPGVYTRALGSTGPEKYSIVLPAGDVAVRYVPDAAQCAAAPQGPLPCTGGELYPVVEILMGGVLNLDIPSVLVSGTVTQNGGVLPDDLGDRGHIEFTRLVGEPPVREAVATTAFGPAGPAMYSIALFPDTYGIDFAGNPALCSVGAAQVPCNRGELRKGVALQADEVLDIDVPKVDLTGTVLLSGAVMPDSTLDRGALRLRPTGVDNGGELLSPAFGLAGPVSYALSVVAGTYDLAFAANPAQCIGVLPTTPCGSGTIMPGLKLLASAMLDVDVPMISVSGAVTSRGAVLPEVTNTRGALLFANDSGEGVGVPLGATGPVAYALGLIPGQYTISYVADPSLCDGKTATAMPCTGGPLQTTKLDTTEVLDLDIPAATISGTITLDGAALQPQLLDRGALQFTSATPASIAVPLGIDTAATYAVTVLPGAYDVAYNGAAACVGAPDNLMPCGGGRLFTGTSLAADSTLDLDIPTVTVTGAITYAAMPLPALQLSRGAIRWTRPDASAGPLNIDLGLVGSDLYSVLVMPGPWLVGHAGNPDLCTAVPPFPCTDQSIVGCDGR